MAHGTLSVYDNILQTIQKEKVLVRLVDGRDGLGRHSFTVCM